MPWDNRDLGEQGRRSPRSPEARRFLMSLFHRQRGGSPPALLPSFSVVKGGPREQWARTAATTPRQRGPPLDPFPVAVRFRRVIPPNPPSRRVWRNKRESFRSEREGVEGAVPSRAGCGRRSSRPALGPPLMPQRGQNEQLLLCITHRPWIVDDPRSPQIESMKRKVRICQAVQAVRGNKQEPAEDQIGSPGLAKDPLPASERPGQRPPQRRPQPPEPAATRSKPRLPF
jgi:hypothetical protein